MAQEQDPLLSFLEKNPVPSGVPTAEQNFGTKLNDFLSEQKPPEIKSEDEVKWDRIRMATNLVKGLGISVVKGALDLPASLGDFMWKRGIFLQDPVSQIALQSSQVYPALTRAQQSNNELVKKGIVTPERAAEMGRAGDLLSKTPVYGINSWLMRAAMKPGLVPDTVDTIGEMAGSIPGNIVSYGAASELAGVGLTKNIGQRTVRHLAASSAATAAQSYLIQLRDGASEWMKVVTDLGVNAAFEAVGMKALRNAWRSELGQQAADSLTAKVAKAASVDNATAELKLSQVRGGGGVNDVAVAQAIVQESKRNPSIRNTPLDFQARRSVAEYWENVVPKQVKVDSKLGPNHGVSFDVLVDGKPVLQGYNIAASKTDPTGFARMTDKIAGRIVELTAQGHSVKVENVQVSNSGSWSRFVRRLRGENAGYGKMDARQLTEFEKNLRSAPRGTVAEAGVLPPTGSKVEVASEGPGPRTVMTVDPDQSGLKTDQMRVANVATGQQKIVPTRNVRVWLYEKKQPVTLGAHSDGVERHMLFDLNAKEAFIEPKDADRVDNYFRSSFFSEIDHEADLNNGPRGFIHEDGSLTLSIPKGERLTTFLDGDPRSEHGPLDRLSVRPQPTDVRPYKSPNERYAHATNIGSPVEGLPREIGPDGTVRIDATRARGTAKFGAGFQPTATRDYAYQPIPGRPGQVQRVNLSEHPTSRVLPSKPPMADAPDVSARARKPSRVTEPPEEGLSARTPGQRIPSERYTVDKGPFITDPELVDAKKAAEILLTTKNVRGDTPVRVVVSDSIHAAAHEGRFTWTLDELAKAEPGLYSFPEIRSAAITKGYRAIPSEGESVILRDRLNSTDLRFNTRLEAANFLSKQKNVELGPKIEEEAEKLMKVGWQRGFDSVVDGGDFKPADAQSIALNTLVDNKRAGVKLWTASDEMIERYAARARAKDPKTGDFVAPPKARARLEKVVEELSGFTRAVNELNDKLGLPKGTLRTFDLGVSQHQKSQVFLYNRLTVDKVLSRYGKDIQRLLKVDVSNPETAIRGLATREAGLDIFSHPDPESAIVYAYLKNTQQREAMLLGRVSEDPGTQRNYRFYEPSAKSTYLKNALPGGQAIPDAQLLDPDEFTKNVELGDVVKPPKEFSFEGTEHNTPPPIMEFHGSSGDGEARKRWSDGISQWVKTRMLLFQKWERESGVPFYGTYLSIEQGRDDAVREFSPFREFLDKQRWKVLKRGDRTDVQMLVENILTDNANGQKAYRSKMDPKHVVVAEETAQEWKKFLNNIGMSDAEINASFKDFSVLRKNNGDFRAYAGMRPKLPRMMEFLSRQMSNANSPLRLDERETDFYSLGVRLARILAYEKHLTPVWNEGAKRIEDAAKVTNLPPDVFNNFGKYMHEVMHTPDDVHIGTMRTMKLFHEKLGGIVSKMTNGRHDLGFKMSEQESIDVLAALNSMGYAANLAYNPSTLIQQYLQTLQTTLPVLGGKYTKVGLKAAVRWLKDPVLQRDMALRGIAGKSSVAQPLSLLDEYMQSKGALGSTTALAVNKFVEKGTAWFQVGDDFNRVVAYMGKHAAVMEHGQALLEKKIDWDTFRKKTKLDLQDWNTGPMTARVREALAQGDVQRAAHTAADHFQKLTQFVYNRGNNPRVLDGALGKLFGQYGTWPLGYANFLWNTATVGEQKLTMNKVMALTTAVATQSAMLLAMKEVFDADVSRWTGWQSIWYRGGPYAELAAESLYVVTQMGQGRGETDPLVPILQRRIANALVGNMTPARTVEKYLDAADALLNGDWQEASRRVMGVSKAKPSNGGAPPMPELK